MLLFAALLPASLPAVTPDRLLWAIAQVETGGRAGAIGAKGERSAWQFMPYTWREYTRAPFSRATTDPLLARLVAETHLRRILNSLERNHRAPTAANVARRWNPNAPADYAQRVSNLAGAAQ